MAKPKSARNERRDARRGRQEPEVRTFNDKFGEERENLINMISPRNESQALALDSLDNEKIIILNGRAGTGKTYLAATHAVNKYLRNPRTKIFVSRPYVTMGKSAGLLPGTLEEKMAPFLAPLLGVMKAQLGKRFEADFGKNIHVQLLEAIRGMDLQNSILLVDEAQNLTIPEIKSIVTRLGDNSQIIFTGDTYQSDLRDGESGLEWLCKLVDRYDFRGMDYVRFGSEDIVRSGLVRQLVMAFDGDFEQEEV